MYVNSAINIMGRRANSITLSTSVSATARLEAGTYDVWSDVDSAIAMDRDSVSDLTLTKGYPLYAKNIVTLIVPAGASNGVMLAGIAGGAGVLYYHRVD